MLRDRLLSIFAVSSMFLAGCATVAQPEPDVPRSPTEIQPLCGAGGRYTAPFTLDGTRAKWVDRGQLRIRGGQSAGQISGGVLGQLLSPDNPLGAIFGATIGQDVGRAAAVRSFGGWDFIRTADGENAMSFNHLDEMAAYLYHHFGPGSPRPSSQYEECMTAAFLIYPRLKEIYPHAIHPDYWR